MTGPPVDRLAADLKQLRAAARKLESTVPREAAKVLRRSVYDELRSTPYRSRRMRNWYGGGAKLAVSYRARRGSVTVYATPPQAWGVVERGARPHMIPKGGKPGPLRIGGRIVEGPVRHPGVRGHMAWSRGIDAAAPRIAEVWVETERILDRAWAA